MFHSAQTGPIENSISHFSHFHLRIKTVKDLDPSYREKEFARELLYTSLQRALCMGNWMSFTAWGVQLPSFGLPFFKDSAKEKQRRQPREGPCIEQLSDDASDDSEEQNARDLSTQMDVSSMLIEKELTAAAE